MKAAFVATSAFLRSTGQVETEFARIETAICFCQITLVTVIVLLFFFHLEFKRETLNHFSDLTFVHRIALHRPVKSFIDLLTTVDFLSSRSCTMR